MPVRGSAIAVHAGVIGDPIAHSKSPQLHLTAYRALGLEDSQYERIRVPAGELSECWRRGDFDGFTGLSVTMPHKQDATRIATSLSPRVQLLGAANTLVVREGEVFAENTDVDGLIQALQLGRDQSPGLGRPAPAGEALERPAHAPARLKRVLIIGGGGTALAALAACRELGVKKATVALRAPQKASQGPLSLCSVAESLGLSLAVIPFDEVGDTLRRGTGAVISTLPPRAADPFAAEWSQAATPVSPGSEAPGPSAAPALLDVAYDPWPSRLAQQWPGRVIHGLEMLLYQAVRQAELFTGETLGETIVAEMAAAVDLPAR